MFPAQLAVCGLLWAFVIWRLVRRRDAIMRRAAAQSLGRRTRLALGLLIASLALLFLGMAALANGGLRPEGGLTWWGWPLIALVGATFIVLQTFALVPLVLNAARTPVTPTATDASDKMDPNAP